MIQSRIESARALPPGLSSQPSGMNWEQKIVDVWPHRYSISSRDPFAPDQRRGMEEIHRGTKEKVLELIHYLVVFPPVSRAGRHRCPEHSQ